MVIGMQLHRRAAVPPSLTGEERSTRTLYYETHRAQDQDGKLSISTFLEFV